MELAVNSLSRWTNAEGRPMVVAGPCSAESEEQLRATASRLHGTRVDFFRAGVWKARTRPGSFEGIGDAALPWLSRIKSEFGYRTATEVATADHVEQCLNHSVDLLWIGARTTVNPFSVQEIATALRGVDVPVLIKNPTSPDVSLWIGAIERIHRAGPRSIGVIHRGFGSAQPTRFRNAPMWEVAIEFRRQLPQIPMISDPSHISGRRDLILELSLDAIALGMNGLMIEVHPNPDQAWSDAAQQITPERLAEVLGRVSTAAAPPGSLAPTALDGWRDQIDHIDRELIALLAKRMGVVERIGEYKKEHHLPSLQLERWRALLEDRIERGVGTGLEQDLVRGIFEVIHTASVQKQAEIMRHEAGAPDAGGRVGAPASNGDSPAK